MQIRNFVQILWRPVNKRVKKKEILLHDLIPKLNRKRNHPSFGEVLLLNILNKV